MAYEAQGCAIYTSTNGIVRTTDTKIGEVTDFTGPGGAAAVIDITHLGSTAKEKMVGLRDEGQLSMTMNFVATDVGQIAFISDRASRTKRTYVLKFNDAATHGCDFQGYAMQFSIAGAVDNKITANAVIEISGAVTYTTAV